MTVMQANVVALFLVTVALSGCGNVTRSPTNGDASGAAGAGGSGGAAGSGGATGSGGTSGSGGAAGTGGTAGGGGRDGGATCDCGAFAGYRSCCGDRCLNLRNDPLNCGACGNRCPTDKPFCDNSVCGQPACAAVNCTAGRCCGASCCQPGQICCSIEGPLDGVISCHTPTADQPSCPPGCAPLCISDRNLKRALLPVDAQLVLTKVRELPISTWQYLSDPENVRHMGPMAQDFKLAFGLGDTDRAYHPIDGHGVALASIQALAQLAEQQRLRIDFLQRENAALERRLQALEKQQKHGKHKGP